MPAAEFEALDPEDLGELVGAWRARERRLDLRHAVLGMLVANMFRGKDSRPVHAWDLFPSLESMRPPPPTSEELARKAEALFR